MSAPLRHLFTFSAIFIVCAIALFFYFDNRELPNTPHPMDPTTTADHSEKFNKEIESSKAVLEKEPDNLDEITRIANLYYDSNQPDSAIVYYNKALAIKSDDPSVLTDCAVMYFQAGNSEKALEYLDKATDINPDLGQAWYNKGFILMAGMGEPKQAVAAWKKFIEVDPESEQAKLIKSQIEAIEAQRDQ